MKYTLRLFILTTCLFGSMIACAASGNNILRTTQNDKSTSRWTPVSSNVWVTTDRQNNTSSQVYSGGGSNAPAVTNRSHSSSSYSSSSANTQSAAAKTHYSVNDIKKGTAINSSLADISDLEFAENDFASDDANGGRPGQQRVRSTGNHADNRDAEGLVDFYQPNSPLSDAVPCLVIMLLAFACIKYRKLH